VIQKAVRTRVYSQADVQLNQEELMRYGIIGTSVVMQEVFSLINRVAPTTTTILLTGETGTGKELIANAIHAHSNRHTQPMIKVNCAAIPENLLESELFGYEKGAFTGAMATKPGRFELAHKGTLFLDEVGELPKEMQVKLLRAIQEQSFERVGGLRTIEVDVRLITATNRNLQQDVRDGRFREDLFYRLNVLPIHLPALRERREDIPALVEFFLDKFNRKLDRHVHSVDETVMDLFLVYNWPGNIREMENLIERLVLMAHGNVITMADVPEELKDQVSALENMDEYIPPGQFKEFIKQQTSLVEKQLIAQCLAACGGNVSRAARELGLSRKALQLKMIKYHLREK